MTDFRAQEAAAILVGAGLVTYEEVGFRKNVIGAHLRNRCEAIGRGLRFRPDECDRVVQDCKKALDLR